MDGSERIDNMRMEMMCFLFILLSFSELIYMFAVNFYRYFQGTKIYLTKILGLDLCADTLVGDEMLKGISGGQKKRLTTGVYHSSIFFLSHATVSKIHVLLR